MLGPYLIAVSLVWIAVALLTVVLSIVFGYFMRIGRLAILSLPFAGLILGYGLGFGGWPVFYGWLTSLFAN